MPAHVSDISLFCKRPGNKQRKAHAKKKWRKRVHSRVAQTFDEYLKEPTRRTPHHRFKAIQAFYAARINAIYRSTTTSYQRFKNCLELLRAELDSYIARAVSMDPEDDSEPVLTQAFEGIVTSITENNVTIEFKVEDDLEVRAFPLAHLDLAGWFIEEGQAVRARCQLEILPTTKPMSEEEIAKWKGQYRDVQGYLTRAKRGKSLLEGEDE